MKKMNYIKNRKKQQSGAAVLIYVTLLTLLSFLILAITQSRVLIAVKRSQSAIDSLQATYQAESEANDWMARLAGGYLESVDIGMITKTLADGTKLEIEGHDEDEKTQVITVTAKRVYAVSKVQAIRKVQTIKSVDSVEMVLGLDCTGSMDAGARCDSCYDPPTRFDAQTEATLSFIDTIAGLPDSDKFKIGVLVFGVDAKWLEYGGRMVRPDSGLSLDEVRDAVINSFGSLRSESPACQGVMDATSMGSAYFAAHQYFKSEGSENVKQIEVVISDGVPNSRIPETGCEMDVFCPAFPRDKEGNNYCEANSYGWTCFNYDYYKDGPWEEGDYNPNAYETCQPLGRDFLSCSLADSDTAVAGLGQNGLRNPEVDAYAVTIYKSPPSEVVQILNRYTSENGYFNAKRADQLKNVLNTVLNEILRDRSTVTIKRLIPS